MIYRSHFAYSTPEGCLDEPYEYYYDPSNVAVSSAGPGVSVPSVVLGPLDKDAPFHMRGVRIQQNVSPDQIGVQFRVNGENLSDDTINLGLYAVGAGFSGQFKGGMAMPWDEEAVLPPGAVIETTWSNEKAGTTFTILPTPGVTLLGVKRYWEGRQVA